jgi:CRISPR-associated protein Cmr5
MPDISTLRGIEQGRANYAYKCAIVGKGLNTKVDKAYKAYAKKIPMLVKSNGLGATFAFIFSKMKKTENEKRDYAYWIIYDQTNHWLRVEKESIFPFIPKIDENGRPIEFADALILLNSTEYRAVTVEIISFFTWLRRFAEGLIEGDDEQG